MVLTQLEQFKVIAEQENISKAAQLLYVSQPSLSQMLNKLESEVGCKLFDRKNGRLHLNDNGRIALEHINTILQEVDFLRHALAGERTDDRPITIGSPSPSAIWYFSSRLREYLPDVELNTLSVKQEKIEEALKDRSIDFAISFEFIRDREIQSMAYSENYLIITVHPEHPLAHYEELYLAQLRGVYFLTMGGPPTYLGNRSRKIIDGIAPYMTVHRPSDPLIFYEMLRNDKRYVTMSSNIEIRANQHIYANRKLIRIRDRIPSQTYYCSYLKSNAGRVRSIQDTLVQHHQDIM